MTQPPQEPQPIHPRRTPIRYILPIVAYLILIPLCLFGYRSAWIIHHDCSLIGGQINTDAIIVTILVTLWTAYKQRKIHPAMLWWAWDAALGTGILLDSSKLIDIRRPNGGLHGFPSGHTGLMFTLSWLMFEMYPALGIFWYIFAIVVGWSRIIVHAHYPYQVIAAAPIGFLIGWGVTDLKSGIFLPRAIEWYRRNWKAPPGD